MNFLKANSVFESGYIDRHQYAHYSKFQCQKKALKNSMQTLIERHKATCLVSPIVSCSMSASDLCYYILFEDGDLYSIATSPNEFGAGLDWASIDHDKKDSVAQRLSDLAAVVVDILPMNKFRGFD